MPKYDVTVQLTGTDGNAFAIIGAVSRALENQPDGYIIAAGWRDEAMRSESYDALLALAMETVHVK